MPDVSEGVCTWEYKREMNSPVVTRTFAARRLSHMESAPERPLSLLVHGLSQLPVGERILSLDPGQENISR